MKTIAKAASTLILSVLLASCSILQGTQAGRRITDTDTQIDVLYSHYPELYAYYAEGLMDIRSMVETTAADGTAEYELQYRLKRRTIRNESEQLFILKDRFPEIYSGVRRGTVSVRKMYEYVDENGDIQYHVDCKYPR